MPSKKTKKRTKKQQKNKLVKVKKSAKPITLEQLRKKALKKNRAQNIECIELDFIVAQDKELGNKWTFIFDGSAMVDSKYVSDFLLGGHTQKKGQMVYLNGVSKQIDDKNWMPLGVQVCDGNLVAWNCMGGTMLYKS